MAARKTAVPGEVKTEPQASTAPTAEVITPDTKGDDQSTSETSSLGTPVEPTAEEIQAKKEYEEFLEWRKNKGKASQPVTPHVPASGVGGEPVAKRTRQVVGKHGWTTEEY